MCKEPEVNQDSDTIPRKILTLAFNNVECPVSGDFLSDESWRNYVNSMAEKVLEQDGVEIITANVVEEDPRMAHQTALFIVDLPQALVASTLETIKRVRQYYKQPPVFYALGNRRGI